LRKNRSAAPINTSIFSHARTVRLRRRPPPRKPRMQLPFLPADNEDLRAGPNRGQAPPPAPPHRPPRPRRRRPARRTPPDRGPRRGASSASDSAPQSQNFPPRKSRGAPPMSPPPRGRRLRSGLRGGHGINVPPLR
jgi:hypothetical protein